MNSYNSQPLTTKPESHGSCSSNAPGRVAAWERLFCDIPKISKLEGGDCSPAFAFAFFISSCSLLLAFREVFYVLASSSLSGIQKFTGGVFVSSPEVFDQRILF